MIRGLLACPELLVIDSKTIFMLYLEQTKLVLGFVVILNQEEAYEISVQMIVLNQFR